MRESSPRPYETGTLRRRYTIERRGDCLEIEPRRTSLDFLSVELPSPCPCPSSDQCEPRFDTDGDPPYLNYYGGENMVTIPTSAHSKG